MKKTNDPERYKIYTGLPAAIGLIFLSVLAVSFVAVIFAPMLFGNPKEHLEPKVTERTTMLEECLAEEFGRGVAKIREDPPPLYTVRLIADLNKKVLRKYSEDYLNELDKIEEMVHRAVKDLWEKDESFKWCERVTVTYNIGGETVMRAWIIMPGSKDPEGNILTDFWHNAEKS